MLKEYTCKYIHYLKNSKKYMQRVRLLENTLWILKNKLYVNN